MGKNALIFLTKEAEMENTGSLMHMLSLNIKNVSVYDQMAFWHKYKMAVED